MSHFVVLGRNIWEAPSIMGVFSSLQKAEENWKTMFSGCIYDHTYIEEWEDQNLIRKIKK